MTNTSVVPSTSATAPLDSQIMDRSVPILIPEAPALSSLVNGSSSNDNNNNSISSRSSPKTSSHSRRGHIRSLSHPFPSPFNWHLKKRNKADHDFLDSDDDDDDFGVGYARGRRSSSPRKENAGFEDEFFSGRCMTCGYTMRWPRSIKSFRCTTCLTINDLEPFHESNDRQPPTNCSKHPAPKVHRKAVPISLERTKALIDASLSKYLRSVLVNSPLPPDGEFPKIDSTDQYEDIARPQQHHLSPDSPVVSRGHNDLADGNVCSEDRNIPIRSRSHSDLPGPLNGDQPRRGAGRSRLDSEVGARGSHPPIFKELEEYLKFTFKDCDCLNNSFSLDMLPPRRASEDHMQPMKMEHGPPVPHSLRTVPMNDHDQNYPARPRGHIGYAYPKDKSVSPPRVLSSRNARINWAELGNWYHLVLNAGMSWPQKWAAIKPVGITDAESENYKRWNTTVTSRIEREIADSRLHLRRTLLKATENLLKRPYRPLANPEDIRFLLILLENPMLYSTKVPAGPRKSENKPSPPKDANPKDADGRPNPPDDDSKSPSHTQKPAPSTAKHPVPAYHSAIIKRILGLLANLPDICHHYLISWTSRYSTDHFQRVVNLVGGFVTYRLNRPQGQQQPSPTDNDLIPVFTSPSENTPARMHVALNTNARSPSKSAGDKTDGPVVVYGEDWQIRAAARVMSILFAANNVHVGRRPAGYTGRPGNRHGHIIPINAFYNTLLDYSDLVADFDSWESKTARFSFCQYPFFLSIWAKIRIMEHDARRQMEIKAREAFFDSIVTRKAVSQYLVLKVRRECLAEDSLRGVSEVIGTGEEEIKKGLRIEFAGEDGIDAGGLRKEWFLLLVREVFDPDHGLFLYDDDSQYCYFNPYCFESSEQFFLVGVLLGLAIYNSTILDIALPPFAFRKLLAAAPPPSGGAKTSAPRSSFRSNLNDLAEYRPSLANGLRLLLEFDGDVKETFCYDFVAPVEHYGKVENVPLCHGGERRPVTNSNRREFVDLYVHYLLDTAVARQFEPFKRGFFTVCGGNALSLFRPEEIELLVRGSDAPLDVATLRAVATYENWSVDDNPDSVPVVQWFWEYFTNADPRTQRKILSFITGSDRIPAMGETSLTIRIMCLGDDSNRYPTARTCFNALGLYRYETSEKLERMLYEAVINGEGFGLK